MLLTPRQNQIIEALAHNNEEAISQLYQAYARRFMQERDLWLNLAKDKLDHYRQITSLKQKAQEGEVRFQEGRFNEQAVHFVSEYIQKVLKEADSQEVSLVNALSIAYDLENTLIEKQFFAIFSNDSEYTREVFQTLAEGTLKHRQKVQEALNRYKK